MDTDSGNRGDEGEINISADDFDDDFDAENNDRAITENTDDPDSERQLESVFEDHTSPDPDDVRDIPAQAPPRRSMAFFYTIVIIIAAVTGGLTGWILLNEGDQMLSSPSMRYEFRIPPSALQTAASTSEQEITDHNTDAGEASQTGAEADTPSPDDEATSTSNAEENTEGNTSENTAENTAENTLEDTAENQDQADASQQDDPDPSTSFEQLPEQSPEQSPDSQTPEISQVAAFSPIRSPKDILSDILINQNVIPLNPELLPEVTEVVKKETGGRILLPTISKNGTQPWQAYKRSFTLDSDYSLIALIIDDMGLNQARSLTAIRDMPSPISFAFAPYGRNLNTLTALARSRGHEVLLSVPMEPFNYPLDDPGPYGLLTSSENKTNLDKLIWIMSRLRTYVGVMPEMGSLFTTSQEAATPVLKEFKKRGLLFINRRVTQRDITGRLAEDLELPNLGVDFVLDRKPSRAAIDQQIKRAESLARSQGFVTVLSSPYPVSLERISLWLATLEEKGFAMAPVTAVAELSAISAETARIVTNVAGSPTP